MKIQHFTVAGSSVHITSPAIGLVAAPGRTANAQSGSPASSLFLNRVIQDTKNSFFFLAGITFTEKCCKSASKNHLKRDYFRVFKMVIYQPYGAIRERDLLRCRQGMGTLPKQRVNPVSLMATFNF
ncbi:hypothetical protein [Actimicrobium sp. CCI2.3]|uniref:hypothetical protein n=1 Tax=Actimicrobium sp. CCI2.3 TaxID=3048616 RepID=UPI002AB3B171|nr:hypothetical protein [Actimicrobium sp. CCI2.3]MDY7573997.1 hypothetical protein [Actimicrobium sp. CCI2.3]MEB0021895.1 hypothetical protein [Actimicrobium sp. CCI2.3]